METTVSRRRPKIFLPPMRSIIVAFATDGVSFSSTLSARFRELRKNSWSSLLADLMPGYVEGSEEGSLSKSDRSAWHSVSESQSADHL